MYGFYVQLGLSVISEVPSRVVAGFAAAMYRVLSVKLLTNPSTLFIYEITQMDVAPGL